MEEVKLDVLPQKDAAASDAEVPIPGTEAAVEAERIWNPLKRLERWYPCTACGHGYHWTEAVLGGLTAIVAVLFIISVAVTALPTFLFCLLTSVVSVLSFIFIWGLASIKSLAGIATDLEKKQRQLEQAKEVMAENSKALRVEVDGIKGEMTQFAAGLGLLEGNLDNLEQVEQGLQRLTDAIEANQNIERELAKHEQHFAKAQNEYLEEKEKENFKDQFVKGGLFDLATDDGLIDSPEEIKNLWEVLEDDPYLKKLSAKGIDWRKPIKDVQRNGKISLWELLDAFDIATDSHFLKVRKAPSMIASLERELGDVEAELDRLAGRGHRG